MLSLFLWVLDGFKARGILGTKKGYTHNVLHCKIFEAPDAESLEKNINDWLTEHSEIELLKVNQSESAVADGDGDLCGNTTVSIFYR